MAESNSVVDVYSDAALWTANCQTMVRSLLDYGPLFGSFQQLSYFLSQGGIYTLVFANKR